MSSKFEVVDKNQVKLTFAIDAVKFEEGMQAAYNKNKANLHVQGFRKGKVPRKLIEATYGKEIFFEDAINHCLPEAYDAAVKELKLDTVSRPEIDVEDVSVEDGAVVTATVFVRPEVSISNYKGIEFESMPVEVTDIEILTEINQEVEKNARIAEVTDRTVKDGDIATIDFEGFIDGVPFEGGKGEDYELNIGSKTFIDTFEEQIIGKNIGDEFDVNVTFPEHYGKEELANQPAVFKVKVNAIKSKELPEINDDFAADVSEFDTLDEYKADIRAKLTLAKEKQSTQKKENDVVAKLIENAVMDVPEVMFENQIDNMVNDFANQIRMQGLSMDVYLQYVGQTMESLREVYRAGAISQVKGRLALEAVASAENFDISETEIDEEITRIAESYQMEKERLLDVLRNEDKEGIIKDL
ncbi:MAG: trigger factor, partial [Defluviitaleaceae bacterium]|nr:trigger factor [Defluviitaleaceae bacterium]